MTEHHDTYEGWSNRETWVTNLWITNDEASNAWAAAQADLARVEEYPVPFLADLLKHAYRDLYEDGVAVVNEQSGWLGDLLGTAWARIDWREIAANFLAE